MNAKKTKTLLLFCLYLFSMVACSGAGRPFDPARADDIPDGPGVFSKGEDGVVLYDSDKGGLLPDSQAKDPQPSPKAVADEPTPTDHEEFEHYQQWLEWKKTAVGTPKYEEFQQWLQWRQYQKWKSGQ
ncbi:uncharacterized protein Dvar_18790 [Desulfosarcina variabilis str. Montpellier]|uniref:hypothetical protein n=1 Tax=Desulfosarcina variabilis TaxID=2300 RepID=UPI003AFB021E